MYQPHNQNATATAIIKGLAIAKYNTQQSKWEVTFLRNCGHYPKLIVREVKRRNDGEEIMRIDYEIKEGDRLFLTVSEPKPTERRYVTAGGFDRNNRAHDAQDFRWMLDIDQLHGEKVKRKIGGVDTNSLSISDGCFYTAVRTRKPYRWKKINSPHPEPLGLTGRTFGVDFEGGSVTLRVEGAPGLNETLPHREDVRYEIVFDSTCLHENQPSAGETDFKFYYRLIDDREGRVDILPPEDPDVIAFQEEPPPTEDSGDPPEEKTPACHSISEGEGGQ